MSANPSKIYKDPDGIKVQLDLDNYFQNNILYGYYEYAVRTLIKSKLKQGDYMLDIGGNIGYMAIVGGISVGKNGKVLCFEPNPDVLPQLLDNLKINGLENVELIKAAASDFEGTADFYCGVEHALSTLVEGTGVLEIKKTIKIPVTTVDKVLIEKGLSPELFNLIKIDVEGYEFHALQGMSSILKAGKASFIVENNPPAQKQIGVDLSTILETFFFPNRYKVFWIESKTNQALFYKKKVIMEHITPDNVHEYVEKSGDFFAEPL